MSRIPWIFGFLGTVAAMVPPGRNLIESAFFSGEALTRNIAQPIVTIGFGIIGILVVLEWYVRSVLHRRRQPAPAAFEAPAPPPAQPAAPPAASSKPTE